MQHAERLCDRLLIMTKGVKAFDGTLAEARATRPRHIKIEADGDLSFVAKVPGVKSVAAPAPPSKVWDVTLNPGAEPHAVLEACFKAGIVLKKFDASEMTLHDLFVEIAGVDPNLEPEKERAE
jgi:ABC-2 type transport system ATP-binding protein